MKKNVIQFESFASMYNVNLQKNLCEDEYFRSHYNLFRMNLGELRNEYEIEKGLKKKESAGFFDKIVYWIGLNRYCLSRYSQFKGSILNIQFVSFEFLLLLPYIRKTFSRIILSLWGSDLYRVGNLQLFLMRPLYCFSDRITVSTAEMEKAFLQKFPKKYKKKIAFVKYGLTLLDMIDSVKESGLKSFADKYKIDKSRKCVVIGYNRNEQQQHISVIRSILKKGIRKEDIFVIIPWTYGTVQEQYKEELLSLLSGNFDFVFLEDYLSDEETVCLRKITDVMIQVQTTDGLSGSMQETLYAGKDVITGKWLPYNELIENGITMHRVDRVEDCGNELALALAHPITKMDQEKNKEVIYRSSSWDSNISKWVDLYSFPE